MPAQHSNHDVVVIGGGPGGYATALYGASAGLDVAIVERDKVGGTCLHRGCVPAKEFLETAHVHRTLVHAERVRVHDRARSRRTSPSASVASRRSSTGCSRGCRGSSRAARSRSCSGTGTAPRGPVRRGRRRRGRRLDPDRARRSSSRRARCRGRCPASRSTAGSSLTSDEFLDLGALPASAAVIGGGAIGCEFASLLADLGVERHGPRGARRRSSRAATRTSPRSWRGPSRRRASTSARRCRVTGHIAVDVGHDPPRSSSTARSPSRSSCVVVSVGRRPLTDGLVRGRHRRRASTSGASSSPTTTCARARPASTRSGTSSRARRSSRTSGSPRRSSRSRASSASPSCPSTTTACPGRSTRTPRSRSADSPRPPPARAATTSS